MGETRNDTHTAFEIEPEGSTADHKSLRLVQGKSANFGELARDCVAFATSNGGRIYLGIEDGEKAPPANQKIDNTLLARVQKRLTELTVNVQLTVSRRPADNGGEVAVVQIARSVSVPSTSDGRYFLRVGDRRKPVLGDDVLRLADERPGAPWELGVVDQVLVTKVNPQVVASFCEQLRKSDRVKPSVKEKSDLEILEHYHLAHGRSLTRLGVLLVGAATERALLGTAPIIQAIKYDEAGNKVAKWVWDDYSLSPVELLSAVWETVPDFRESYELPNGMFRERVPAYEEAIIRELVVNALVHRPYTQRGDIFLNLHPTHLEVVNPGRLPLGVRPDNILHVTQRRNDNLARVFHDLKLMEREGSGFDLIYERLFSSGKEAPEVREGVDSVHVVVSRRVLNPRVIQLIHEADAQYQLTQRERIVLGRLALSEGMRGSELAKALKLDVTAQLDSWIGRLRTVELVQTSGRKGSTRYFVAPELLRGQGLDEQTTLVRVEPHRLRALIEEDVTRYPGSSAGNIHRRIGREIPVRTLRRVLSDLVAEGHIRAEGEKRGRRYFPGDNNGHEVDNGR
jgi:ATP-dependent DNA helicase RecG